MVPEFLSRPSTVCVCDDGKCFKVLGYTFQITFVDAILKSIATPFVQKYFFPHTTSAGELLEEKSPKWVSDGKREGGKENWTSN